jgi:flagellar biogenesis protein FliO
MIEALSVGTRQKLALVRVGDHEVLIGISPGQITALTGEMAAKSSSDYPHLAKSDLTLPGATNVA